MIEIGVFFRPFKQRSGLFWTDQLEDLMILLVFEKSISNLLKLRRVVRWV